MSDTHLQAITAEKLEQQLRQAGAKVMVRSGSNQHYGSPREFSFEVKALFPNGMGLHILARQYGYRDPWETQGRVNDLVDVMLQRDGRYTELPRGFEFFQQTDTEEGLDGETLQPLIEVVRQLNPKLYTLQQLTGDL